MSQKRRLKKRVEAQGKRHVERAWQSYEREVLPKDAGPTQRHETRLAFYAGAAVLFEVLGKASEGNEGDAMKLMSEMQQELSEYGQQLDRHVFGPTRGQA